MNIRMKFSKGEEIKYISHLDLMRTFQRAIRRGQIPIKYSKGFNPHPEMSFAQALSLGISSKGEYLDINIKEILDVHELKDKLNRALPEGLVIKEAVVLKDKAKSAMSLVTLSEYQLYLRFAQTESLYIEDVLLSLMDQEEIFIEREKSRKDSSIIKVNIRPMIRSMHLISKDDEQYVINCILSCGSRYNLKPEFLLQALEEHINKEILYKRVERIELYMEQNNVLVPLLKVDSE